MKYNERLSHLQAAKAALDILNVILNNATNEQEDKPFNGIRKVSDNHIDTGVIIPADGSAVEMQIPEGLEIFISDDGKAMIRKKVEDGEETPKVEQEGNPITYDAIAKKLFFNKNTFFPDGYEVMQFCPDEKQYLDNDNCVTEAQAKRCFAFNKLQNIAKYLNKGWMPNFDDVTNKYHISKCEPTGNYYVTHNINFNEGNVYFKTKKLAEQAIKIMGKESLEDLFNINW